MESSSALAAEPSDVATAIAGAMRQMRVAGFPRNYEIFYEAFAGNNNKVWNELSALGPAPAQSDLDKIALRHFAGNNREEFFEDAHDRIITRIEEIMSLLAREKNALERYGIVLTRTSDGLDGKQHVSRDFLRRIVGIMAIATDTTIEHGKQIVTSITDKSSELEVVKSSLEEYKRLADTDPLTQIANRRAFDKKMVAIYGDSRKVLFNALILADIDLFKSVNDLHGHPVGDRILQQMARILTASMGANMFVARTGGEEFGIIVEGLTEPATLKVADDIRQIVEKSPFEHIDAADGETLTISMGVCMAAEASDPADLYAKADKALYASKLNGRNRISKYPVPALLKPRKDWYLYRKD